MRILLIGIVCCLSVLTYGADRYWIASANANWNNTSNWSTSSGGAGGASVPGSSDKALFDGNGLGTCTIDIALTVNQIDVQSGFTDTLFQSSGNTITVNSTAVFADGFFVGNDADISIGSDLTISGADFTSTSATLQAQRNFTLSGSGIFNHNNGWTQLKNASLSTPTISGKHTFNKLEINANVSVTTYTISDTITVEDSLLFTSSGEKYLILQTGTIVAEGDVFSTAFSNYITNHSAEILFQGSGNQWLIAEEGSASANDWCLPSSYVRKNADDTLFVGQELCIRGSFVIDSGFVHMDTTYVRFLGDGTIGGDFTVDTLRFQNIPNTEQDITLTTGTELTVTGALGLSGNRLNNLSGGIINVEGDVLSLTTNLSNVWTDGSTWIVFNGSGNQTWYGISHGSGWLPKVEVNKSGSDTLFLDNLPMCISEFKYTSGFIDCTDGVMGFGRTTTINPSVTLGKAAFLAGNSDATSRHTVTTGQTLTVTDSLWVKLNKAGVAVAIADGTIDLKGHLIIENPNSQSSSYNDATLKFTGNEDQVITGIDGDVWALPYSEVDKDTGVVIVENNIELGLDMTLTKGIIWCDSATAIEGIVIVPDGIQMLTPSDTSYVDGTVWKVGDDAFTFPVGSGGNYQPIVMSAPASATDEFSVKYYQGFPPNYDGDRDSSITHISECEYWDIHREVGTSNVNLTFPLDSATCTISDSIQDLGIGHWTGSDWEDLGQDANTGDVNEGTLTVNSVSSYCPFVLIMRWIAPKYTVLRKKLDGGYHTANGGVRFKYNEEYNDQDGELTYNVYNKYHRIVGTQDSIAIDIDYGYNNCSLNMTCSGLGLTFGHYILEVINEKNEKWYLRFYNPRSYICGFGVPIEPTIPR